MNSRAANHRPHVPSNNCSASDINTGLHHPQRVVCNVCNVCSVCNANSCTPIVTTLLCLHSPIGNEISPIIYIVLYLCLSAAADPCKCCVPPVAAVWSVFSVPQPRTLLLPAAAPTHPAPEVVTLQTPDSRHQGVRERAWESNLLIGCRKRRSSK